uniref:Uncharacterized protein n=1 Tax=Rhipicephalus microplus TaxID=6941 RepID=A0A6G5AFV4_RHIMP
MQCLLKKASVSDALLRRHRGGTYPSPCILHLTTSEMGAHAVHSVFQDNCQIALMYHAWPDLMRSFASVARSKHSKQRLQNTMHRFSCTEYQMNVSFTLFRRKIIVFRRHLQCNMQIRA